MKETYLAVAGRIRRELDELHRIVERVARIWKEGGQAASGYHVDAVALNLHGCYAGIERIFEVIASRVDQTVPTGPQWHQELLEQMNTDIPSVRPAVLSSAARRKLDRYRGFRHVVRNVYTMDLDPQQIELLVSNLPSTMDQVTRELLAFAETLERIALEELEE